MQKRGCGGILCGMNFNLSSNGGRRSLPRLVHGFAAGGAYAGHQYSQTGYERCDVQAPYLSPGFSDLTPCPRIILNAITGY